VKKNNQRCLILPFEEREKKEIMVFLFSALNFQKRQKRQKKYEKRTLLFC